MKMVQKLNGFSLPIVLILMTIMTVSLSVFIHLASFNKRQSIKANFVHFRSQIIHQTRDSLETTIQSIADIGTDETQSKLMGNGYRALIRKIPFQWGIRQYVLISVYDHLDTTTTVFEISRTIPIPDQTVLIYDQPGYSLTIGDSTHISGSLLTRNSKLNYGHFSSEGYPLNAHCKGFSHFLLLKSFFEYDLNAISTNSSLPFKSPDHFTWQIIKWAEIDWSKEYRFCVFVDFPSDTITKWPLGQYNQFLFQKDLILNASMTEASNLVVGLDINLKVTKNKQLHGNIFLLKSINTDLDIQFQTENCQLNGLGIIDGLVTYKHLEISGCLIVPTLQTHIHPTIYRHVLYDLLLTGGFSKSIRLPGIWTVGKVSLI